MTKIMENVMIVVAIRVARSVNKYFFVRSKYGPVRSSVIMLVTIKMMATVEIKPSD